MLQLTACPSKSRKNRSLSVADTSSSPGKPEAPPLRLVIHNVNKRTTNKQVRAGAARLCRSWHGGASISNFEVDARVFLCSRPYLSPAITAWAAHTVSGLFRAARDRFLDRTHFLETQGHAASIALQLVCVLLNQSFHQFTVLLATGGWRREKNYRHMTTERCSLLAGAPGLNKSSSPSLDLRLDQPLSQRQRPTGALGSG